MNGPYSLLLLTSLFLSDQTPNKQCKAKELLFLHPLNKPIQIYGPRRSFLFFRSSSWMHVHGLTRDFHQSIHTIMNALESARFHSNSNGSGTLNCSPCAYKIGRMYCVAFVYRFCLLLYEAVVSQTTKNKKGLWWSSISVFIKYKKCFTSEILSLFVPPIVEQQLSSPINSFFLTTLHAVHPPEHSQINTRKQTNKQKQKIKQHYYSRFPHLRLDKQSFIHSGLNQKSRKKCLLSVSRKYGKKNDFGKHWGD